MVYDDLAAVLAWRNDQDVRRYMYTQHEITFDEHCRWFAKASGDPKRHLLIFEDEHESLGFVSFTDLATVGTCEWGFYTAPSAPRGTGRKLGHAALEYAFTQLRLHKVCGRALAYNRRSIEFHGSLGFKQEGVLREQYFDGARHHDIVCFGLLHREWQSSS